MDIKDRIYGGLMGVVVGDALGLPVQFKSRAAVKAMNITGMTGMGTFNLPAGSWSDDSSLTLCLAASIVEKGGLDEMDIARKFVAWRDEGYMTPYGFSYDIGKTTEMAVLNMKQWLRRGNETAPLVNYGQDKENDNGNGALMRILPAAIYCRNMGTYERAKTIARISGMTHGHIRSQLACIFYSEVACSLLEGEGSITVSLDKATSDIFAIVAKVLKAGKYELGHFIRISTDLDILHENEIQSTGYVIDSLVAAVWCVFNNNNFRDTVLAAVNLGGDTDTIAAIAGGLAGIIYGRQGIPVAWVESLAKKRTVKRICDAFADFCE